MGMLRNPLTGATASLALTLGVIGAFAGSAAASTGDAGAAANTITVCVNANGGGCAPGTATTVSDALKQLGRGFQDNISSITNPTPTPICFYEHNNFQGRGVAVPPGSGINNLANVYVGGSSMNDVISSWRPMGGGGFPPPPPGASC
ncbi:peptidase inhibitor family I36 protein [Streptomyces sp. NPDC093065]|uniref:peptidase inhibitor family I36 protein n=1 Tax=Streptomyces sp. NPDC093065 TaxID=3366021 RepID=UPI003822F0B7